MLPSIPAGTGPWCAEPQRRKLVEFFASHPGVAGDRGKAVRASWYAGDPDVGPHVRLSVWSEEGQAEAAVSLDPGEAGRLARFLGVSTRRNAPDKAVDDVTVVLDPAAD